VSETPVEEVEERGHRELAGESATQTARKSKCPGQSAQNSAAESEKESDESDRESEKGSEKPVRQRGGRKSGFTDEVTKLQNVKIMRTMLQSKKMLGSLLGFGRKQGTEFKQIGEAFDDLAACLKKHEDIAIQNLALSAVRKRMKACLAEAVAMVKDTDREKVVKILHNGNVGSDKLSEYDKCILDIARFYDKFKNVDRLEAAKIDARKDSRLERREHAALELWEKYSTEESRRRNEAHKNTLLTLNKEAQVAKGVARSATAVSSKGQAGSVCDLKRLYQEMAEESNEMDLELAELEPDSDDFKKMDTKINAKRRRMQLLQKQIHALNTDNEDGENVPGDTLTPVNESQFEQEQRESAEVLREEERAHSPKATRKGFQCLKPNRKRSSAADVLSSMGQEEGSLAEMLRSSNESSKAFGDEFFAVQKEKIKLEQKQHEHRVAVDQANLRLEEEKLLLQFMSVEDRKVYVAQKLKALGQQGGP
jgi:hypothetical protein